MRLETGHEGDSGCDWTRFVRFAVIGQPGSAAQIGKRSAGWNMGKIKGRRRGVGAAASDHNPALEAGLRVT